ncbi:type II secretion system protein J [Pseudoalteromonas sp. MMG012]|uniref:PulJ/GspJ family protein n=1 Tax=Pseudoalteromonas sp. MMG012 TaxID=2822686 RepID=UPI001B3A1152|nr:prepilin-type N-terminal cleavage/methylation domain-containing protein [Pseudoalteromonas sp. MMG012]MBQ4849241.1 prepilin-type N-terminal cleavage/methylation domain-containing protein [Pseudoalteromonas sp. MMG012]
MSKRQQGFTLVEVLVASVILFSVLAVVSLVYRGAITASVKATQHLKINAEARMLIVKIEQSILELSTSEINKTQQKGQVNGIEYIWKAQVIDFRSAPKKFDVDLGTFIVPPRKYKLWRVTLNLEHGGVSKELTFHQLGWNNA